MTPTNNKPQPEAVLRLSDIDTELMRALAKHWLVIAEQQGNKFVIDLYTK